VFKVRLYDESAQSYHRRYRQIQHLKYQAIATYLENSPLVDVGVGTGIGLKSIVEFTPVVGVDWSIEMLRIAFKQIKKSRKCDQAIMLVCASAEALPFRDHAFPTAISITVIQNLSNIQVGIQELIRIVHPSGLLVVTALEKSLPLRKLEAKFNQISVPIARLENLGREDGGLIYQLPG
jgi:ubiquinone/menaquinone biosynthesis C-methylase UbiE